MELCKQTLEDHLVELNAEYDTLENSVGHAERLRIGYQILQALRTIHQTHKLIHRDLSLKNIFIGNDSLVKIGDFGLATKCQHLIPLQSSPITLRPTRESEEIDDPGSFCLDEASDNEHITTGNDLTHGLGTKTFASPEQLSNIPYDQSVSY